MDDPYTWKVILMYLDDAWTWMFLSGLPQRAHIQALPSYLSSFQTNWDLNNCLFRSYFIDQVIESLFYPMCIYVGPISNYDDLKYNKAVIHLKKECVTHRYP